MEKREEVELVKDGLRRKFSPTAAKIATRHLGWSEIIVPPRPPELLKKTLPREISTPVKLIQPPVKVEAPKVEPVTIPPVEIKAEAVKPEPAKTFEKPKVSRGKKAKK